MANKESQIIRKLEWHLLPWDALEEVVKVFMGGKDKYGANNWRTPPGFKREEVLNAIQRHTVAMVKDKKFDHDSPDTYHAAHLVCEALFYLWYEMHDKWNREDSELEENLTPKSPTPLAAAAVIKQHIATKTPSAVDRETLKRYLGEIELESPLVLQDIEA